MDEQNINTNVADNNDLARSTAKEENPFSQQSPADTGEQGVVPEVIPTENPFSQQLTADTGAEQGAVDPEGEQGAVAQEGEQGAVAQEGEQGAVAQEAEQGAVAQEAEQGAVAPEGEQVAPESTEGEQVAPEVAPVIPDIGEEITLKIGKSTLVSLCQNLNTNLLVNIAAYKSVLAKLKDSEKDETKKGALDSNIETLNTLESNVSALLNTVQTNLDIPDDKKIDPETVIKEASSSNASSGNFMTKLLGAEAAAILGSMAAATVLMLGGGKYKRRKFTKRRRNKKQKSTKSNKK
jgi:hypothetical protein